MGFILVVFFFVESSSVDGAVSSVVEFEEGFDGFSFLESGFGSF